MLIDTKNIVSITEANQNFSKIVRKVDNDGFVVIFKNNQPKYIVLDVDSCMSEETISGDSIESLAIDKLNKAKWL